MCLQLTLASIRVAAICPMKPSNLPPRVQQLCVTSADVMKFFPSDFLKLLEVPRFDEPADPRGGDKVEMETLYVPVMLRRK